MKKQDYYDELMSSVGTVEQLQSKLDTLIRKVEDAQREIAFGEIFLRSSRDILRASINEAKAK